MRADILAAVLVLSCSGVVVAGGQNWLPPAPSPLPAPVREEVIGPIGPGPTVDFVRPNPYDVWQLYAVDNFGRFRPRIGPSPDGPRYLYNNAPFPWWREYTHETSGFAAYPANFAPAIPTERPPAGFQPLPPGIVPPAALPHTGPAPVPVRTHPLMPRCED